MRSVSGPGILVLVSVVLTSACGSDAPGEDLGAGGSAINPTGSPGDERSRLDAECAQGKLDKCRELAGLLFKTKDSPDDHQRGRELLKKACDGGVATACASLGTIHEEGRGVAADANLGRDYYTKACELAPGAACTLAATLWSKTDEDGTGFSRSMTYFELACGAGEKIACQRLGMAHWRGVSRPSGKVLLAPDAARARSWFVKGCEADNADCCHSVGIFYDTGTGGSRDHARAREFYRRACRLGNKRGCFNDAYTTGDRFVLGDFAYTVTAVEKRDKLGGYFSRERASSDAFFLTVKYKIENLGKETATVLADDFKVVAEDGREFSPSSRANTALAFSGRGKDLLLSEVHPGVERTMQTAFELPDSVLGGAFAIEIPEKGLFGTDSARVIPSSIFTTGRKKPAPMQVESAAPRQTKPAPVAKPKKKKPGSKAKPTPATKPAPRPKPKPKTGFKVD